MSNTFIVSFSDFVRKNIAYYIYWQNHSYSHNYDMSVCFNEWKQTNKKRYGNKRFFRGSTQLT